MFYMCCDNSPHSGLHIYQVNKKSTEICSATHLWNTKRNPLKNSPFKKRVEKEKNVAHGNDKYPYPTRYTYLKTFQNLLVS